MSNSSYTQTDSETDSLLSNSLSSQSTDSDYIPSQTPESEDYTSYESSEPLTPTESEDYTSYESTPTELEETTDLKNS